MLHWTRFSGVTAPHESDPLDEDGAEFYVRKASDGQVYAQPIHWRSPLPTASGLASGANGDVRLMLDSGRLYAVLGSGAVTETDWTQLGAQKFAITIGNGASTTFTVIHSLASTDLLVQVWDMATGAFEAVPVTILDADSVSIGPFSSAPTVASGVLPGGGGKRVVVSG